MDKYFDLSIKRLLSLAHYETYSQFNDLTCLCSLLAFYLEQIELNSLKRETWLNLDKNPRTWHRCNLWSHTVHCTVWFTVHSPARSEQRRNYTGLSIVHWKLAPDVSSLAAQLRSPGAWLGQCSMFQIMTRFSATVSPQQPSALGSPASEQKVKMLNSTTKLTESFVLKQHRYS